MKKTICLAVFLAFLLVPATNAEMRTWTSAQGQHKIEAEFVKISDDGKTITLRQPDGKEIHAKLDGLSKADQVYVAKQKVEVKPEPPVAVDLKEELQKSGFEDFRDFAFYGTAALKNETIVLRGELEKADPFDKPAVKAKIEELIARIKAAQAEIAKKVFVAEYDCSATDVNVDGNKSSFTMLTMEIPLPISTSKIRSVSVPNANCETPKITESSSRNIGTHWMLLPISGNTDSIKELVRNCNSYQARIVFKIRYNEEQGRQTSNGLFQEALPPYAQRRREEANFIEVEILEIKIIKMDAQQQEKREKERERPRPKNYNFNF